MTSYYPCASMISVPEVDITTPTSAQKYPLGYIHTTYASDAITEVTEWIYIQALGAALTAYIPKVLTLGGVAAGTFIPSAPVTLGAPGARVIVPQVAFTSGYYGFAAIKGVCTAAVKAETYVVGDAAQLLSGGVTLVVDGSTGDKVRLVNTCGFYMAGGTTALNKKVCLLGEQAVIAAT